MALKPYDPESGDLPCVSVPQPWAADLVLGQVHVINFSQPPELKSDQYLLIHASRQTRTPAHHPDSSGDLSVYDRFDQIIGSVRVSRVTDMDGVDLQWACGPWCVVTAGAVVLMDQFPYDAPLSACRGDWRAGGWRVFGVPAEDIPQSPRWLEAGKAAIEFARRAQAVAEANRAVAVMRGDSGRVGKDGWTGD